MDRTVLRLTRHQARFAAIALLVMLGLSLSCSTPQAKDSIWAGLPADIRERVHLNVSEIPPFPENHDSLRDIRKWPNRRSFDGEHYELMIEEWEYDAGRLVGSPDEVRPGSRYAAKYVRRIKGSIVSRGPSYFWGPGGEVYEQGYRSKERTDARVYDPAGRLMQYNHSRPDPRRSWLSCSKRPRIGAEEHFDASGKLVGFFTGGKNYWAGHLRGSLEYSDSLQKWNPWIAWRDSVRRAGGLPR
jgi:hypothetical protein